MLVEVLLEDSMIQIENGDLPKFFPSIPSMMLLKDTLSTTVAYLVQRFLFMNVVSKGSVFPLLKNPITTL